MKAIVCADALRLHRHYAPGGECGTEHRVALCGAVVYDPAAYRQVIGHRLLRPIGDFDDLPRCVPCDAVSEAVS